MAIEAKLDAPVLVVDDDPKIQALVSAYLKREGLGVVTASDGAIAIEEIRRARPRLVVLDLMLPGLDGMSVLRQLRQESDVPVLILSARGSTSDRVFGITEGTITSASRFHPPSWWCASRPSCGGRHLTGEPVIEMRSCTTVT